MHQGVSGATAAYATGAAVMALPWVLTTALLASLPAVIGQSMTDLATARTVVNVALTVALLVAGPIQIVLSRFAADRLYEGRLHAIAAPMCRGVAAGFLVCAVVAAVALLALQQPARAVVWGAALAAVVGAQWIALSAGNGLCAPSFVLVAVGIGSASSFVLASGLVLVAGLGAPGYVFGLIAGQAFTLVMLLVGIFRVLPDRDDPRTRLLPAFRDYGALAAAGLAFNASLWTDKLTAWQVVGGEAAALHNGASTLAWFSTIPCLAWVYVEVETRFHRRFRRFYRDLEGGAPLAALRRGVRTLRDEAARLLLGALSVQCGVIVFLQLASGPWARELGMPTDAIPPFRLLLVAAGAQALGLLGLILLYYFDLRREACAAAVGLLIAIGAFTLLASASGLPPSVGTALGCSLGAVLIWRGVFRGIGAVLQSTLLAQPYVVEDGAARKPAKRRPKSGAGYSSFTSFADPRLPPSPSSTTKYTPGANRSPTVNCPAPTSLRSSTDRPNMSNTETREIDSAVVIRKPALDGFGNARTAYRRSPPPTDVVPAPNSSAPRSIEPLATRASPSMSTTPETGFPPPSAPRSAPELMAGEFAPTCRSSAAGFTRRGSAKVGFASLQSPGEEAL